MYSLNISDPRNEEYIVFMNQKLSKLEIQNYVNHISTSSSCAGHV